MLLKSDLGVQRTQIWLLKFNKYWAELFFRYIDEAAKPRQGALAVTGVLLANSAEVKTAQTWGGVKTERVFPGLSVLRKNNKMEVLSPEK